MGTGKDKTEPRPSWFRVVWPPSTPRPELVEHRFDGSGTVDDPFIVTWLERDPQDPLQFPTWIKWCNLLFAAYPIVYQEARGWGLGASGLPFLGIMVGILTALAYSAADNLRYQKVLRRNAPGQTPPEARLMPCMVGSVFIPAGMFWFAWTNAPSVHWMASIAAGAFFGFGLVLVFFGITTYLVDSYTVYAASVLAGSAVLRAVFAAVFPLFTGIMYENLGLHWASSVPGFLALAWVPFPFVLYKYGHLIRTRSRYAAEAEAASRAVRPAAVSPGPSAAE